MLQFKLIDTHIRNKHFGIINSIINTINIDKLTNKT